MKILLKKIEKNDFAPKSDYKENYICFNTIFFFFWITKSQNFNSRKKNIKILTKILLSYHFVFFHLNYMIKITFEAAYDKKTIYPRHFKNNLFSKNRRHMRNTHQPDKPTCTHSARTCFKRSNQQMKLTGQTTQQCKISCISYS